MRRQRYISANLTHFVGRSIVENGRYMLLKKILKSGVLEARPRIPGLSHRDHVVQRNSSVRLSTNEACIVPVVCFCDIPLEDLGIHMRKYSEFGMAFSKHFLAGQGASPVIYVPRKGRPSLLPYEGYGGGEVAYQAVAFDHFLASGVTSKPTIEGHFKTGQWTSSWTITCFTSWAAVVLATPF